MGAPFRRSVPASRLGLQRQGAPAEPALPMSSLPVRRPRRGPSRSDASRGSNAHLDRDTVRSAADPAAAGGRPPGIARLRCPAPAARDAGTTMAPRPDHAPGDRKDTPGSRRNLGELARGRPPDRPPGAPHHQTSQKLRSSRGSLCSSHYLSAGGGPCRPSPDPQPAESEAGGTRIVLVPVGDPWRSLLDAGFSNEVVPSDV